VMIPTSFEYHAPDSIEAALDLIDRYGDDCKILSGGHSLIPLLKLRLASPAAVIDIGRIGDLGHIRADGSTLRIGALATHAAIGRSDVVSTSCPLLVHTARLIGDQQVRNRGTIGGSLTHADPAADWPAAMLALEATIKVRSRSGERTINAADFFIDAMTSAVQPGEIVTEIIVPIPAQPAAASYFKVRHSASGFAVIGVAVQLKVENGVGADVRIGVTGLSPRPFRAKTAEALLKGQPLDEKTITAGAAKADTEATDTMDDIYASGEYRRHLTRVHAKRALRKAAGLDK